MAKKALKKAQPGKETKSTYQYGKKPGTLGSLAKSVDDAIQKGTFGLIDKSDAYNKLKERVKTFMRTSPHTGKVAPKKRGGEPNPANYKNMMNGGAMGYYADKAKYGREQARKKMMDGGSYNKMI
jgi:hypothetical protein